MLHEANTVRIWNAEATVARCTTATRERAALMHFRAQLPWMLLMAKLWLCSLSTWSEDGNQTQIVRHNEWPECKSLEQLCLVLDGRLSRVPHSVSLFILRILHFSLFSLLFPTYVFVIVPRKIFAPFNYGNLWEFKGIIKMASFSTFIIFAKPFERRSVTSKTDPLKIGNSI